MNDINQKVHFIAIGGAVMHNLAIALKKKGYQVTGSDDEIFEPSRSRLATYNLLPSQYGWHPERITNDIDTVILGMHATGDNPELIRAKELGITVMSFPEYLYQQTRDKRRIIVGGSHGKTTITAMIMHVFKTLDKKFDFMVGSQIDGFDTMVGLSDESEYAVFEGDEYLTSPLDRRPKFHLYMPDIAIINGIAWDHMNVFPTFDNYVEQFRIFINKISTAGTLLYYDNDPEVKRIAAASRVDIDKIPYGVHPWGQDERGVFLLNDGEEYPIKVFGEHNMQNISAAKAACLAIGINERDFYMAMESFTGTAKRLQKIYESDKGVAWLDFAHSPSKVRATVDAVASRYPGRDIVACFELHTFSSLNAAFLPQYSGTMDNATHSFVCFSKHAIELKKLPMLTNDDIRRAFGNNTSVYDNPVEMFNEVKKRHYDNPVFLFMSSGNFDNADIQAIIKELIG